MHKIIIACLLLSIVIFGLKASGINASAPEGTIPSEPFTVTDALGRSISFESSPQRMIVAGRAFFMIVDALYLFPGVGERIAATSIFRQRATNFLAAIDPNATAKAVFETNVGAEQIAAFHPDVVILKSYLAGQLGTPLDVLGIPIVYVDLETPEQYERDIRILGKVLGQSVRTEELVHYYQQGVERIQSAVQDLTDAQKPRILLLQYSDRDGIVAFQVPPGSWMQTRLVELAGGIPVWRDSIPGNGWTTVTLEQIGVWDADAIFIVSYFNDPADVTRAIKADPNWRAMRAVQAGKLYAFPGDFNSWDQPNPRWILGLTWLAHKLHPDRFAAVDIIDTIRAFYHDLYGLDSEFFESHIRPILTGDLP
jgi:iron complex transport system substrate-binding protein